MTMEKCVFCKLAIESSRKAIYENDNFFSVPDINPIAKGHSLVISKRHFKTILDVPGSLGEELLDCVKNTAMAVLKETKSEGFNVIGNNFPAAGQAVHHVHMHLIPRKKGDGLRIAG
jgi:histidine triad (HIT) family protein